MHSSQSSNRMRPEVRRTVFFCPYTEFHIINSIFGLERLHCNQLIQRTTRIRMIHKEKAHKRLKTNNFNLTFCRKNVFIRITSFFSLLSVSTASKLALFTIIPISSVQFIYLGRERERGRETWQPFIHICNKQNGENRSPNAFPRHKQDKRNWFSFLNSFAVLLLHLLLFVLLLETLWLDLSSYWHFDCE